MIGLQPALALAFALPGYALAADEPVPAAAVAPAPAAEPAPAASPAAVTVTGRVAEQGTGSAVLATVFATVFTSTGASGHQESVDIAVQTDADGQFSLVVPPDAMLTIQAAGYITEFVPVPPAVAPRAGAQPSTRSGAQPSTRPGASRTDFRVYLRRGTAEAQVVVEARRDSPVVAEQHLDRERVNQTPGTFDDAMRLMQSLPGVTQTPEYSPRSGDIAVRGSFPGDNHYYLDGIELPYLFHYNNYASVLPTRMVDDLTLYPSTFASRFGDATGAVIDATSVWHEPDRVHASLNVSVIMAAAGVEVPLTRPGNTDHGTWTLRANARRSYVDLVSPSSLQYPTFPAFSDWFARVEHADRKGRRWSVVGFGAADGYVRYAGEPTLLDPWQQAQNPEFTYNRQFQVAALQHMGARETDNIRGSLSFTNSVVSGVLPAASAVEGTRSLVLREDAQLRVGDSLWVAAGGELAGSSASIDVSTDKAWSEVERESELLALGVSDHEDLLRLKGAVYVEPRWEPGPVRIQPGVRVLADSLTASVAVDPRFGVRVRPAADTYLRAATGVYTQFPTAIQLSPVLGDPSLQPARSVQVAGGVDQAISGRWELSVDGWAKWGHDIVVSDPGVKPEGGHESRAIGGSFSTRYRLKDRFFAWASFDISQSLVSAEPGASAAESGADSEWFASDYDQPFAVNLVASWTFAPTWNVGLRYRVSAGLPYTPIEDGRYLASSDSYEPVSGTTNSGRLPTYQKVDLHVEKRIEFHNFSLTPYLEAWYVPESGNVMYLAWSYDYDQVEQVHGPGFVPLVGVRGEL